MRKLALVLCAFALASCAKKNVSAHSDVLDWDVPSSVAADGLTSQQALAKVVEIYHQQCGANESFELADKQKFDVEFEKMMVAKGYKKVPLIAESGFYGLDGPKQLAAIFGDHHFTVCELRK